MKYETTVGSVKLTVELEGCPECVKDTAESLNEWARAFRRQIAESKREPRAAKKPCPKCPEREP